VTTLLPAGSDELPYRPAVRGRVFAAFQRLAPAGLLRRRAGDVGSTAISDVELLEVFFAHTLTQLVSAAVVPLGATIAVAFMIAV
jgi:ATP-binding cassette, subfamily C, bacterial CydC